MLSIWHYQDHIHAVDAAYVRPQLAAIHLIVENGRVAIVDTGSRDALPPTLAALRELGLSADAVDYVILTHIHLDHAGGAGLMMQAFPQAQLVVHPRGAAHMVDPAKLIAGVIAVYGEDAYRRLYGEILPIDAQRIVRAADGQIVSLAGRELQCLDTPGHARHHLALVDLRSGSVFTGDIFGMSYRELDSGGRQFLFPTTSPVQFDPPAMHASIDRVLACRPQAVYLTHFSQLVDVERQGAHLHRLVDAHVAIAERERNAGEARHQRLHAALSALLLAEIQAHGCPLSPAAALEVIGTDVELNAQGMAVWLDSGQAA